MDSVSRKNPSQSLLSLFLDDEGFAQTSISEKLTLIQVMFKIFTAPASCSLFIASYKQHTTLSRECLNDTMIRESTISRLQPFRVLFSKSWLFIRGKLSLVIKKLAVFLEKFGISQIN